MATFTEWLRSVGLAGYAQSQGYGANPGRHGYGAAGHGGVDIAAPTGTPLRVPAGVTRILAGQQKDSAGNLTGWGNYLRMYLADGSWTQVAHLAEFVGIKPGQSISNPLPGGVYAKSGNTGNSTGPHVDIERRTASGARVNPSGAVYPTAQEAAAAAARGLPFAPYITPDGSPPGPGLTAISQAESEATGVPRDVWQSLGINAGGVLLALVLVAAGVYLLGRSF